MNFGTTKDALSSTKSLLKNLCLGALSFLLAWVSSGYGGYYLCKVIYCGSSWIDADALVWLLVASPLFLAFLFTLFGDRWKYLWITVIFLLPFFLLHFYEMFFSFLKFMLPGLVLGWALAFLLQKFFLRHK